MYKLNVNFTEIVVVERFVYIHHTWTLAIRILS